MPVLANFVDVVTAIVFVDAILSWILPVERFPRSFTSKLTEPLYRPFRAIIPAIGGIDFSGFALIMLLRLLRNALLRMP